MRDVAYLQLLAREFPSVKEATGEIVNLMAICSLPKGTEYFFSDLHGEYEAFIHLLRSSSGIIREKIKETFGYVIPEEEQLQLANLIYYPERHLPRMMKQGRYTEDWQRIIHLPAGTDLPGGGIQVYPFQGPQKDAEGICIYH